MAAPLRQVVPSRLAEVPRVAAAAAAFLERERVPDRPAYIVQLVIEELLTNIAKYANAPGGDPQVTVELRLQGDDIVVRVEDEGVPFDPSAGVTDCPPGAGEELTVGGRGLRLCRGMTRNLQYRREDGRNVVEARVALSKVPSGSD